MIDVEKQGSGKDSHGTSKEARFYQFHLTTTNYRETLKWQKKHDFVMLS